MSKNGTDRPDCPSILFKNIAIVFAILGWIRIALLHFVFEILQLLKNVLNKK